MHLTPSLINLAKVTDGWRRDGGSEGRGGGGNSAERKGLMERAARSGGVRGGMATRSDGGRRERVMREAKA